jgi:hypothetical protein
MKSGQVSERRGPPDAGGTRPDRRHPAGRSCFGRPVHGSAEHPEVIQLTGGGAIRITVMQFGVAPEPSNHFVDKNFSPKGGATWLARMTFMNRQIPGIGQPFRKNALVFSPAFR